MPVHNCAIGLPYGAVCLRIFGRFQERVFPRNWLALNVFLQIYQQLNHLAVNYGAALQAIEKVCSQPENMPKSFRRE